MIKFIKLLRTLTLVLGSFGLWVARADAKVPLKPEKIAGDYLLKHITSIIPDSTPLLVEDTMSVKKKNDREITFSLEGVFGNGHQCSASGSATLGDGAYFFHSKEGDLVCDLKILVDEKKIELSIIEGPEADSESGCESYCGARGSLDGMVFYRKNLPEAVSPEAQALIAIEKTHRESVSLFKQKKYDAAVAKLSSIESDPATKDLFSTHVLVMNDFGYFLEQKGDLLKAEKILTTVTEELDSRRAVTRLNLGDVFSKAGQPEKAKLQYRIYAALVEEKKWPKDFKSKCPDCSHPANADELANQLIGGHSDSGI